MDSRTQGVKYTPMERAQMDKQCPICWTWFMSKGQRDAHVAKKHEG